MGYMRCEKVLYLDNKAVSMNNIINIYLKQAVQTNMQVAMESLSAVQCDLR